MVTCAFNEAASYFSRKHCTICADGGAQARRAYKTVAPRGPTSPFAQRGRKFAQRLPLFGEWWRHLAIIILHIR